MHLSSLYNRNDFSLRQIVQSSNTIIAQLDLPPTHLNPDPIIRTQTTKLVRRHTSGHRQLTIADRLKVKN